MCHLHHRSPNTRVPSSPELPAERCGPQSSEWSHICEMLKICAAHQVCQARGGTSALQTQPRASDCPDLLVLQGQREGPSPGWPDSAVSTPLPKALSCCPAPFDSLSLSYPRNWVIKHLRQDKVVSTLQRNPPESGFNKPNTLPCYA